MKKSVVYIVILLLSSISCSTEKGKSDIDFAKPHLKIIITFNPDLYRVSWFKKYYPIYALWAKDIESGKVRTIYVTKKAAKWESMIVNERPSSVPVWFGVRKREPQGSVVDSISSATPWGKKVTHYWQVPDSMLNKEIDIYLEGNISFDYNNYYKKNVEKEAPGYSDVNGQPSLIWKATLKTVSKDIEVRPKIIGHGHVLGENHDIDENLSEITTAKKIFLQVNFTYIIKKK